MRREPGWNFILADASVARVAAPYATPEPTTSCQLLGGAAKATVIYYRDAQSVLKIGATRNKFPAALWHACQKASPRTHWAEKAKGAERHRPRSREENLPRTSNCQPAVP